jgi:hypothetical protein
MAFFKGVPVRDSSLSFPMRLFSRVFGERGVRQFTWHSALAVQYLLFLLFGQRRSQAVSSLLSPVVS